MLTTHKDGDIGGRTRVYHPSQRRVPVTWCNVTELHQSYWYRDTISAHRKDRNWRLILAFDFGWLCIRTHTYLLATKFSYSLPRIAACIPAEDPSGETGVYNWLSGTQAWGNSKKGLAAIQYLRVEIYILLSIQMCSCVVVSYLTMGRMWGRWSFWAMNHQMWFFRVMMRLRQNQVEFQQIVEVISPQATLRLLSPEDHIDREIESFNNRLAQILNPVPEPDVSPPNTLNPRSPFSTEPSHTDTVDPPNKEHPL